MKFAFISDRNPTQEQIDLAAAKGHTLVPAGYANPFLVDPACIAATGDFDGVVVDHLAAVRRLRKYYTVGFFDMAPLSGLGSPPGVWAKDFRVFEKE
jgi:hypothetical protein